MVTEAVAVIEPAEKEAIEQEIVPAPKKRRRASAKPKPQVNEEAASKPEVEEQEKSTSHNKELGSRGEEAAVRFLERRGFEILERNWTCP
ncbi:MAG: hypothetical protein RR547_10575, partial [Raoultibacter sp.]